MLYAHPTLAHINIRHCFGSIYILLCCLAIAIRLPNPIIFVPCFYSKCFNCQTLVQSIWLRFYKVTIYKHLVFWQYAFSSSEKHQPKFSNKCFSAITFIGWQYQIKCDKLSTDIQFEYKSYFLSRGQRPPIVVLFYFIRVRMNFQWKYMITE